MVQTDLQMCFPGWFLLLSLLAPCYIAQDEPAHRRFEYKYSFKRPHVTLPDGTIPFWETFGDAVSGPDEVRLVSSLKNRKGSMWTKNNSSFPHWEVEMSITISGHGREGAEGLAFWYTREKGELGTVFGAADLWDGVAIIFDTFDHDSMGNNPAIVIVGNNGKLQYDHLRDGSSQALGTCVKHFRNTIRPFKIKITYYKRTLRIFVQTGFSPRNTLYEQCAQVPNMVIPSTGYFGISAATSALADNHDVFSFMVYSLSTSWEESPAAQIPKDERERYEKEYEEFQKELEKNMEDFQKKHPVEEKDEFESESQRELEMILFGQTRLLEETRVLKTRLNMTLEAQIRHREILTNSKANETTTVSMEHVHSSLETVMNGMPDLLSMIKDLKNDIKKMAKDLSSPKRSDSTLHSSKNVSEVKDDFRNIRKSLQSLVKSPASPHATSCPSSNAHASCLSSGVFLTFLFLQSVCTVAFMFYRRQTKTATKKFY
ncbi:protein ERGIC-53-like [Ranitomeya imitator]|uniref:protein ERGIC-53-like n=1 Tax=Ranitomeya imitator TaxID=111125 RepID=UPI0037E78128